MNILRRQSVLLYGSLLWILSVQYYVTQFVVASGWSPFNPYSWMHNTKRLWYTRCGLDGPRQVCSPLHPLMNLSFIVLAVTMVGGALFLRRLAGSDQPMRLGYGCLYAAGVGTVLVESFPENTVSSFHILGAGLAFILGNVAMLIFGLQLSRLPAILKWYSIISGSVGLVALGLFFTHTYLGLGIGGMERFTSYPLSIWMTILGVYFITHSKD